MINIRYINLQLRTPKCKEKKLNQMTGDIVKAIANTDI